MAWTIVTTGTVFLHKLWLKKPNGEGGIEAYHPKISGFEKLFKKHRPKKSSAIVPRAMIKLPTTVETYLDESAIFAWHDHAQNILYLTLKCGYERYEHGGDGESAIMEADAPREGTQSHMQRNRYERGGRMTTYAEKCVVV